MATATPVYKDDWVQLYLGNCKDVIWDIPFHTVDALISDPPYLITTGNITWDGGRNYIDTIGENGFADSFDIEIVDFIHDNLLKRTNMLFFCNRDQFEMYMSWVKKHKKNFQLLSWHKPDSVPLGNLWLPDTEYMFHVFKDLGYLSNKQSQHTYFMHNVMHSGLGHPTEKPEKIMTQLILQLTNEGDTIIDPFLGTATTAVCAKRLGRKCIGIEIKEKYMDIAIMRCKQAGNNELQSTMF